MSSKVALVARGIYERSDSIAHDCLWQYDKLRELSVAPDRVRVFAENIHESRYADRSIEPIGRLWPWIEDDENGVIIYHFCDGWTSFEERVLRARSRLIVRWHNNTPPWFFASYSTGSTANTVRGFERVLRLAGNPSSEFWVNSTFSARQLHFLGVPEDRIHVVYPASAYLSNALPPQRNSLESRRDSANVLFVGRVTPHKGHKHLIGVCALAQSVLARKIALHFVGRPDPSMRGYVDELWALARKLSVPLSMHGEVKQASLQELYAQCDVFLALSEHEGFGLPLFEAMRLGIPVVALRTTAVGDLLGKHPLSVASLDYQEIALRIVSALEPAVRERIAKWQQEQILTQYDAEVVTRQLMDGMGSRGGWPEGAQCEPCVPVEQAVEAARARLRTQLEKATSALTVLREIAKDTPDRLVTRYDIAAYSALIAASHGPSLFEAALEGAASDRRLLGPPLRLARRLAVSIQSGLISALRMMDANADARFARLERSLSQLRNAIEAIEVARAPHSAPRSAKPDHDRVQRSAARHGDALAHIE